VAAFTETPENYRGLSLRLAHQDLGKM